LAPIGGSRSQPQAKPRTEPGGNYFLGLVFGVLFALGGAIVYGLGRYFLDGVPFIGWLTGWLVLMVGYLAGLGVDKGYKGGNVFAGLTAAAITLMVVLITKFVVFAALIAPHVKHAIEEAAAARDDDRVVQMVMDEEMAKKNLNKHTATEDQQTTFEALAMQRVKSMTDAEYKSYERKADAYETRQDLAEYVQADVLKEKKLDPDNAPHDQEVAAAIEADRRIAGMTDSEVTQKLKNYNQQAAAELEAKLAAARNRHSDSSSNSNKSDSDPKGEGISGSLIGFGIVLGLIFLVWWCLPAIIAMLLAYKVAANP
jgi:hypothetical protein